MIIPFESHFLYILSRIWIGISNSCSGSIGNTVRFVWLGIAFNLFLAVALTSSFYCTLYYRYIIISYQMNLNSAKLIYKLSKNIAVQMNFRHFLPFSVRVLIWLKIQKKMLDEKNVFKRNKFVLISLIFIVFVLCLVQKLLTCEWIIDKQHVIDSISSDPANNSAWNHQWHRAININSYLDWFYDILSEHLR